MTRPRNACGGAVALHVILKSGICGLRSFHGLSGSSRAHGRLVTPRSIQPFATSMPVMCMPWQVEQVRLVGLPRPTVFRCCTSRIQNVRNMKTSWPRAIDSRMRLRSRLARRRAGRQLLPDVAHRKHPLRGVVAEHARGAGGEVAHAEPRRAVRLHQAAGGAMAHLRRVHLALELDDLLQPRVVERAGDLQVRLRRADGLRLQRRHARVGHHVHRGRQARLGIAHGGQRPLADEREHAEAVVREVLRVGDRARAAIHRDRRRRDWSGRSAGWCCSRRDRARPRS